MLLTSTDSTKFQSLIFLEHYLWNRYHSYPETWKKLTRKFDTNEKRKSHNCFNKFDKKENLKKIWIWKKKFVYFWLNVYLDCYLMWRYIYGEVLKFKKVFFSKVFIFVHMYIFLISQGMMRWRKNWPYA